MSSAKIQDLTSERVGQSATPIVFPWEIINDDGTFIEENIFRSKGNLPDLHKILTAAWTRARAEVQAAKKISFVGLSMHEYLNWGFKFLFHGKKGKIQLAVTDKDSAQRGRDLPPNMYDPLSPTARISKLRDTVCPEMQWNPFEPRQNFEEFIIKEMGPLMPASL